MRQCSRRLHAAVPVSVMFDYTDAPLASDMDLAQRSRERVYPSISVEPLDEALVDALVRLVELLEKPVLVPSLAPLIQQEITIRLLAGPSGAQLRHLVAAGSPLQYQKQLRLQQARQVMLNQNLDAGNAGGRVGYESASQFSREYSRLFGAPPQQDVKRLRSALERTASADSTSASGPIADITRLRRRPSRALRGLIICGEISQSILACVLACPPAVRARRDASRWHCRAPGWQA
jgi:AraC-like DNA-binding protein